MRSTITGRSLRQLRSLHATENSAPHPTQTQERNQRSAALLVPRRAPSYPYGVRSRDTDPGRSPGVQTFPECWKILSSSGGQSQRHGLPRSRTVLGSAEDQKKGEMSQEPVRMILGRGFTEPVVGGLVGEGREVGLIRGINRSLNVSTP